MMLKVEELAKEFIMYVRGGLKIDSFRNVSFVALSGKMLAVTGPSGIGKSSLLKCIYRTYQPTGGAVYYQAADGSRMNLAEADHQTMLKLRRTEIGYVSQFLHVIPRVSALDILSAKLSRTIADEAEARETAREYLGRVGISENLWEMYPSTFSGGEKQRLNILMALAAVPRLLLLDEPTASLDSHSKEIIIELILDAKKKGTTMIGVFHDQEAIKALADHRYDMRDNLLVAVS
jgi:alpha-D-ribose 1-methylphosphonate 5-triphosphate synthase subunit PhnL